MPSRFDKYRVKDGRTALSESFFNPVFQDLDLRLVALEEQQLSWRAAVQEISDFGLARIEETISPAYTEVLAKAAVVEEKRLAAIDALGELEAALVEVQSGVLADVETWKDTNITALESWQASLTAELPGINARLDSSESIQETLLAKMTIVVVPDVTGSFSIPAGATAGNVAVVSGLGLYRYDPDNTDIADGETVLAPSSGGGRWVLVSPHWDFVWAYLAELFDDLQDQISTLQTGKFDAAKILVGSASLDFASMAAGASATLTITVPGAAVTDRVVLNQPATLPNGVVTAAYVSAENTVTVRLNNVTAAAIDPAAMTYLVTVIKP